MCLRFGEPEQHSSVLQQLSLVHNLTIQKNPDFVNRNGVISGLMKILTEYVANVKNMEYSITVFPVVRPEQMYMIV